MNCRDCGHPDTVLCSILDPEDTKAAVNVIVGSFACRDCNCTFSAQIEMTAADEDDEDTVYFGCRHPAWGDPLRLMDLEDATRWYNEHKDKHPQIYVLRQVIKSQIVLGPAK